jgi:hypothetical protein
VPLGAPPPTAEVANLARSFTPGSSTAALPAASASLVPPAAAGSTPGESPSPPADPALRLFQAAADDESLHASVLGSSAHLRVQTATGEDLSLHLRVRDGIADVRVDRAAEVRATGPAGTAERAEPRAELKASEVQAALAGEGLALGRFESSTAPQQPRDGEGAAAAARASGIPALEPRASFAPPVVPVPTIGGLPSERERPPAVRLATALGSGGARGSRPVSGSTGSGRATGYDLGARRPGLDEAARVVAGPVAIASNASTSGTGPGANPNPNLDQHPSSNQTLSQGSNRPGGTGTATHAPGGAGTETYSSPHQHQQRHPHREGAAEGDGVRRQHATTPARVASITTPGTTPGPRDPQTTAMHSDGTPGVHVTA